MYFVKGFSAVKTFYAPLKQVRYRQLKYALTRRSSLLGKKDHSHIIKLQYNFFSILSYIASVSTFLMNNKEPIFRVRYNQLYKLGCYGRDKWEQLFQSCKMSTPFQKRLARNVNCLYICITSDILLHSVVIYRIFMNV